MRRGGGVGTVCTFQMLLRRLFLRVPPPLRSTPFDVAADHYYAKGVEDLSQKNVHRDLLATYVAFPRENEIQQTERWTAQRHEGRPVDLRPGL